MEEADRCTPLANDVIRQVIQPLIRMDLPAYVLSNEEILAYTGIDGGVAAVCTAMENAVTCKFINCDNIKRIHCTIIKQKEEEERKKKTYFICSFHENDAQRLDFDSIVGCP